MYKFFVTTFFDANTTIHQVVRLFGISFDFNINGSANLKFSIQNNDDQVTDENFKPYNLIHLHKEFESGYEKIGIFYIENTVEGKDYTEFQCQSLFNFFHHRVCEPVFSTAPGVPENAGTLCRDLLDYTNGQNLTPVTSGINDCSTNVEVEYKRRTVLDCWQDIINSTTDEVWVDENLKLNIGELGEDKRDTLIFKWNWAQSYASNINEFSIDTFNKDMATKVYGVSEGLTEKVAGGLLPGFPLLETVQNFDSAKSDATLQQYTDRYYDGHRKVIAVPKINPTNERKFWEDYWVGDTCTVKIKLPKKDIEVYHRIVSINVTLDDQLMETVTIDTVDVDLARSNRRKDIIDVMVSQEKRLYWLSIKDSV